jgi:nucleoside-diphosphate-sugar epimerase
VSGWWGPLAPTGKTSPGDLASDCFIKLGRIQALVRRGRLGPPASEYAAVVPRFILAYLQGEDPVIHGDGTRGRDFTYVDDVVEGTIQAAEAHRDAWGAALNVGEAPIRPR